MDFWKGLVRPYYRFSNVINLIGLAASQAAWQTVGQSAVFFGTFRRDISILRECRIPRYGSGLIAGSLFSHVSTKVLYINFVGGPPLLTSKGRIIWGGT